MAKRYVPATTVVTCDRCGNEGEEAKDYSDGWDSNFTPSHYKMTIDNKTLDLCYTCYHQVRGMVSKALDKPDVRQVALSNTGPAVSVHHVTMKSALEHSVKVGADGETYQSFEPEEGHGDCCQGGKKTYGKCHGCLG